MPDAYSKIPKPYSMDKINTEEVMDKMDMLQSRFGKINELGWWDLERISLYAGTQFYLTELKYECQTCGVHLVSAAPEHQEMNGQVEVIWRMLRTIAHSLMVHVRVSEAYIHFALMYTADNIFQVLKIRDMINEYGKPTTPFKLTTITKPSVSHLRVLFCPCVVQKYTAHFDKKVLNMRH